MGYLALFIITASANTTVTTTATATATNNKFHKRPVDATNYYAKEKGTNFELSIFLIGNGYNIFKMCSIHSGEWKKEKSNK